MSVSLSASGAKWSYPLMGTVPRGQTRGVLIQQGLLGNCSCWRWRESPGGRAADGCRDLRPARSSAWSRTCRLLPQCRQQERKAWLWLRAGRVMVDFGVPSGRRCCLPPGCSSAPSFQRICGSGSRRLQFWLIMQEAVMGSPRRTMGAERLMCPHSSQPGVEESGP